MMMGMCDGGDVRLKFCVCLGVMVVVCIHRNHEKTHIIYGKSAECEVKSKTKACHSQTIQLMNILPFPLADEQRYSAVPRSAGDGKLEKCLSAIYQGCYIVPVCFCRIYFGSYLTLANNVVLYNGTRTNARTNKTSKFGRLRRQRHIGPGDDTAREERTANNNTDRRKKTHAGGKCGQFGAYIQN